MSEVKLDLQTYDNLCNRLRERQVEIRDLIKSHEAEIQAMVNEGKVKIITRMRPFNFHEFMQGNCKTEVEYKGFDDVKLEVVEHFKQGIFEEELEKEKQKQLDTLIRTIAEQETTISSLKENIESFKKRSLWERIRNKF